MKRIKKLFNDFKAERRRNRWLRENLAKLTDPTFLDRVEADQ